MHANAIPLDFMDVNFRIRQDIIRERDRGRIKTRLLAIEPSRKRLRRIGGAETFGQALAVAERRAPAKVWIVNVPRRDKYEEKQEGIEDDLDRIPYGSVTTSSPSRMSFDIG
jgi:hypothetical protein